MRQTPAVAEVQARPAGQVVLELHGTSQWPPVQSPPAPAGPQAWPSLLHFWPSPTPGGRQARFGVVHSMWQARLALEQVCEPVQSTRQTPGPLEALQNEPLPQGEPEAQGSAQMPGSQTPDKPLGPQAARPG